MVAILAVLIFCIICSYYLLANGFVIYCFWDWFIVPIFPVEPITLIASIGLGMFVSFMTIGHSDGFIVNQITENNKEASKKYLWYSLSYPWITLILGFIISLFL